MHFTATLKIDDVNVYGFAIINGKESLKQQYRRQSLDTL